MVIKPPEKLQDRLGRPLHDLRLSVIDRCNFRCPYCMPAELYPDGYPFFSREKLLQFDEIERLVKLFAQLGASKLRLTGGEPLLRKDLADLIARLATIDGVEDIAMSTNAILLPRHAQALYQAGLRRVTVSLDSLDPKEFLQLSGNRGSLAQVLDGIAAAQSAGFEKIKINAVIKRGMNDQSVLKLVEHFRNSGCTLRFIEFMDVGTLNAWQQEQVVSSAEILAQINKRWPVEPVSADYRGEVAQRYRFTDGAGEIGFISSVSKPFCRDCTRARLSADGKLYTCLFAQDGMDLKTPLRAGADDDELLEMLTSRWRARTDRYSELRAAGQLDETYNDDKVEMYQVGG